MNIQELPPIDAIIELDNKAELIDEEKIQKAFPGFERIEPTINKEGDKEILNSSSDSVPDYEDVSEFNSISKGDEYRIFEVRSTINISVQKIMIIEPSISLLESTQKL